MDPVIKNSGRGKLSCGYVAVNQILHPWRLPVHFQKKWKIFDMLEKPKHSLKIGTAKKHLLGLSLPI